MHVLAGLVKTDLAAATEQDRRHRRSKSTRSRSSSSQQQRYGPPPPAVVVDPATAREVQELLLAMERRPRDRRLVAHALGALQHVAVHEAATALLLRPEALRVLWDAAQLHVDTPDAAVLEAFLQTLLCLTERSGDRACVRQALPGYAPVLIAKLRARVDRGSAGARALELLARRLAVVTA